MKEERGLFGKAAGTSDWAVGGEVMVCGGLLLAGGLRLLFCPKKCRGVHILRDFEVKT